MSKKSPKGIRELQKEYSKPQITRWEKQHKIQRIVLFSGIGLIIAVFLLIGGGWYFTEYQYLVKPLVTVNGTNIRVIDFIKVLRVYASSSTTDINSTASQVLNTLEQSEILKQAAAQLKVSVTHNEVMASLKTNKQSTDLYPFGLYSLLYTKLQDDYFVKQVPTTADQRDVEAMFLESEQQATDFINQLNQTANPDDFKTKFDELAKAYSWQMYVQTNSGELGMHSQEALNDYLSSTVPADNAFSSELGILSQPTPDNNLQKSVGYWLIYIIEKGTGDNAGKVYAGAMLLGSEAEAENIKGQLDAITDPIDLSQQFSDIAKKYSQYTNAANDGGLLGWVSPGSIGTTFDNVAFNMNAGTISDPVKDISTNTKGGYWLIKVVGISNGSDISQDDINTIAQQNFATWLQQQSQNATINDHSSDTVGQNNETIISWAISKINKG